MEFENNQGFQDDRDGLDLAKISTFILAIGFLLTSWGWYNAEQKVSSLEKQNYNLEENITELNREIELAESYHLINHSFIDYTDSNITEVTELTHNNLISQYNLFLISSFDSKAEKAMANKRYKEAAAYHKLSKDYISNSKSRLEDSKNILDDTKLRGGYDRTIEAHETLGQIQDLQVNLMYAYEEGDEEKEEKIETEIAELTDRYNPSSLNTQMMDVMWLHEPLEFGATEESGRN